MNALRIPLWGALLAVAAAVWNPYRSEIWTSLTLSEGVAMPYAMLALLAAVRAPRSRRPWAWDIAGALAVLAAMGCKNTFMALIPAQMFLRLDPLDLPLREGLSRHGARSLLLGLAFLAPVAHLVYFKLDPNPHPHHYKTLPPSIEQAVTIARCLKGAIGLDFLGAGLAACGLMVWLGRRIENLEPNRRASYALLTAAGILLAGGAALYLPLRGMSPRYSMPAVWGLDLAVAWLFGRFVQLPRGGWKHAACGALVLGFVASAAANVGKQQKFIARADVLWQAVEALERECPAGSAVAVYTGDALKGELDPSEAIHIQWHLEGRGRGDLRVQPRRSDGEAMAIDELPASSNEATYAVAAPTLPIDRPWRISRRLESTYRFGRASYAIEIGRLSRPETKSQPVSRRTMGSD